MARVQRFPRQARAKTVTFWDRQAPRFDQDPPTAADDEAMRRALDHLGPDDRVLEIGCAAGAHARAMRPYVTSWHGTDISTGMIRRAQAHAGEGLSFEQATIDVLEPGDHTAIVAFNVLHFMDPDHAAHHLARLLPPGGLLVAQTPCLGDLPWFLRGTAIPVARMLGIGLRSVRFEALRAALAPHFDIREADATRPSQTWIAARRKANHHREA